MTTETYDNKPKFDPNKSSTPVDEGKPKFNPNKPYEDVKKKDIGGNISTGGSMDGKTTPKLGSNGLEVLELSPLGVQQLQQQSKLEAENNKVEEHDPLGAEFKPLRKEATEKYNNAVTAINNARSESVGQKVLSPIHQAQKTFQDNEQVRRDQEALFKFNEYKEQRERQVIPEAGTATAALVGWGKNNGVDIPVGQDGVAKLTPETLSKLPQKNETVKALVKRVNEYGNITDDFNKSGGNIEDAAVISYAKKNPFFAEQLSKMQEAKGNQFKDAIPAALRGRIINDYLQDPNVKLAASKNEFSDVQYDHLSKNLLTEIPEYGASVVGTELSHAIEKDGKNNWLANPSFARGRKEYIDELAEKLFSNDPQKLQNYHEVVSKDLGKWISTPGVVEHGISGFGNALKGQINSVEQWLGMKNPGQNIYEQLKQEGETTSSGATGLHSVTPIVGDMGGLVIENIIGGKLLKGLGIVPDAETANTITNLATFYGNEKQKADAEFAGDENKSIPKAALMALMFNKAQHLIPTKQLSELLGKVSPEIDDVVSKLADGTITKAAAQDGVTGIFKGLVNDAAKTGEKVGKAALENMAITEVSNVADRLLNMNPEQFRQSHPKNELIEAAKMGIFGTLIPNALAVAGDRNTAKNNIYDITNNPERYKRLSDEQALLDPEVAATNEDRKALIDHLSNVKQTLDEHGIPISDQKSYLLQSAAEQVLTKKIEATKDPVIQKKYKDELKKSQEIKEGILQGIPEDAVKTTADQKAEDQQAKVADDKLKEEADRNKLIEKGHTAIDKLLEEKDDKEENVFKGMYREIAKKDPVGFLEDIAGQINGVQRKEGDRVESDQLLSDLEHTLIKKYGADVVNVAKELFPYKEPVTSKISVQLPEEVENLRRETTTISPKEVKQEPKTKGPAIILPKTKEDAIQEPSTSSILQHPQEGVGEQGSERIGMEQQQQGDEATGTQGQNQSENQGKEEVVSDELPLKEPKTIGVRHESLKKIADRMGLDKPERGTFLSTEEQTKRGRLLLQGGADPEKVAEQFKEDGKVNADDISVARAHFENLVKEENAASEKFGRNSPERAKAKFEADKWSKEIMKPMGTASGGAFSALKGETDFDTGSFIATSRAVEDVTGKPISPEQEKVVTDLTGRVKGLEKQVETLKKKLTQTLDKETTGKIEKVQKKTSADFVKERKDAMQAARDALKKLRSGESGLGAGIPLARELAAIAPHVAKIVKSLIEEGVDKLHDIVDRIHDEFKDDIKGLRSRDIIDVIAGDYTKQTEITKNEQLADIKRQSKLVKKLEDLQNGLPEDYDKSKTEPSAEVKNLVERIKKVKKDLADMGYMEKGKAKEKTTEEKNVERLEKQLQDLKDRKEKNKPEDREHSDKEKELEKQIAEEKSKIFNEDITTRFIEKYGTKFSDKDVQDIWKYAKDEYLNKGKTYYEMVKGVSMDLGLSPEQVRRAIEQPKGAKAITDEMYRKQVEQRKAIQRAKIWVKAQSQPRIVKYLKAIPQFFFEKAIFGHGTVGMITHGGAHIFRPSGWATYFKNFAGQFKNAFGGLTKEGSAAYEKRMEDLTMRENFTLAKRAGLANDPNSVYDDYQGFKKFFGKLGMAGDRGFNALKEFRQDLFDNIYNNASEVEKADPEYAKTIAKMVNHSTGTSKVPVPEGIGVAVFAPRLEASRWTRLITQPAKAIITLTNWNNATPSEKAAAKIVAKRTGEMLATYAGLLAVNQGLLMATGSKQQINLTNPSDSDWLKFKIGDETVDVSGGLVSAIDFVGKLVQASRGDERELKRKTKGEVVMKDTGKYLRGKLSPFGSTAYDFLTHHDYSGNTLPMYKDKPDTKFAHKMTWGEWLSQEQTPIPVAEAMKDIAEQMKDNGMHPNQIGAILHGIAVGAISGGTGARVVPDYKADKKK